MENLYDFKQRFLTYNAKRMIHKRKKKREREMYLFKFKKFLYFKRHH